MCRPSRRGFMMGCSAAIANLAAARFTNLLFADPMIVGDDDILIVLFLRGGMDGLSYVLPTGGVDRGYYEAARVAARVNASGTNAALAVGHAHRHAARPSSGGDGPPQPLPGRPRRLHPGLGPRRLQPQPFRQPGTDRARHARRRRHQRRLADAALPRRPDCRRPRRSCSASPISSTIQTAWLADTNVVAFSNRDDFLFNTGPSAWRDAQKTALRNVLDLHIPATLARSRGSSRSTPRPSSRRTSSPSAATCRRTAPSILPTPRSPTR